MSQRRNSPSVIRYIFGINRKLIFALFDFAIPIAAEYPLCLAYANPFAPFGPDNSRRVIFQYSIIIQWSDVARGIFPQSCISNIKLPSNQYFAGKYTSLVPAFPFKRRELAVRLSLSPSFRISVSRFFLHRHYSDILILIVPPLSHRVTFPAELIHILALIVPFFSGSRATLTPFVSLPLSCATTFFLLHYSVILYLTVLRNFLFLLFYSHTYFYSNRVPFFSPSTHFFSPSFSPLYPFSQSPCAFFFLLLLPFSLSLSSSPPSFLSFSLPRVRFFSTFL